MLKTNIAILLFVFYSWHITAQPLSQYKIRSLTTDDGLPQGFITSMVQDKQGFIWLSTRSGLARYDGKNVKVFYHSRADSNSLLSSDIRFLSIDNHENIWIQYANDAIDIFNPVTEKIRHLSNETLSTSLITDGIDVIFSKVHFDKEDNAFVLFDHKNRLRQQDELRCLNINRRKTRGIYFPLNESVIDIANDIEGNVWMASDHALYILHNNIEPKKFCDLPEKLQSQMHLIDTSFLKNGFNIRNNEILLSTSTSLWIYNKQSNQWKEFSLPSTTSIKNTEIEISPSGEAYIEVAEKIFKINDDKSFSFIWANDLKFPEIITMMIDQNNVLWVSTNTFGTRMIDLNSSGFHSYRTTRDFCYDVIPAWGNIPVYENFANRFSLTGSSCLDKNGVLWIKNFFYEIIDGQKLSPNSIVEIQKLHAHVFNIPGGASDGSTFLAFDAKNRCWMLMPLSQQLIQADIQNQKVLNRYYFNNKVALNSISLVAGGDSLWIVYTDGLQLFSSRQNIAHS